MKLVHFSIAGFILASVLLICLVVLLNVASAVLLLILLLLVADEGLVVELPVGCLIAVVLVVPVGCLFAVVLLVLVVEDCEVTAAGGAGLGRG